MSIFAFRYQQSSRIQKILIKASIGKKIMCDVA